MQNYLQQIIENAHNYPQPKLTWSCVGQKIASKVVVSAAAISFPFRQFPAFHQHRLRIHLPGAFQRHSQVLCLRSGWRIVLPWPREISSGDAAGQCWKNRVPGQLESSRICKRWGSPPEHKCGLSNLKARRRGITKVVFLCAWDILYATVQTFFYCYLSLYFALSVLVQCPKQVIISKIYKGSSWA